MANGNNNGGTSYGDGFWRDMPWWVKAIAIVGVPSLISIGVVLNDRLEISNELRAQGEIIRRVESQSVTHDSRVWMRFDELSEATRETNRILLAQCVNEAAKSTSVEAANQARDRCLGGR